MLVFFAALFLDSMNKRLFGGCLGVFGIGYVFYGWPGTLFPVAVYDMIDFRKIGMSYRWFFNLGPAAIWIASLLTMIVGLLCAFVGFYFASGRNL